MQMENLKAENAANLELLKQEFERWKTQYDSNFKLNIAHMSGNGDEFDEVANPSDQNISPQPHPVIIMQGQMQRLAEAIQQMQSDIAKPRVNTAIRGEDGKIQQAISEVVH